MPTGTITDLDAEGQFGVIEADDGQFLLFNLRGIDAALRHRFHCGARVQFIGERSGLAPRACALSILQSSDIDEEPKP